MGITLTPSRDSGQASPSPLKGEGISLGGGMFCLQHLRLWGLGFGFVCWEGAGDGRSGTREQGAGGRPAHPTCVCEGGRGGENLPVWGFPVHQKGSMALGAPGCGALSIRRQVQCRPRRAPCKRGAASFGCYGPSLRPFHWEDLCRIKRGYIGCDGPPSGGPVPG